MPANFFQRTNNPSNKGIGKVVSAQQQSRKKKGVIFLDIDGMSLIEKIDKNPGYGLKNSKSTPRDDLLLQTLLEAKAKGYDIVLLTARPKAVEGVIGFLEKKIGTLSTNTVIDNFRKNDVVIKDTLRATAGLKGNTMAKYMAAHPEYDEGILLEDQLKQVRDVKEVAKKQNNKGKMRAFDVNSLSHLLKLRQALNPGVNIDTPFMTERELIEAQASPALKKSLKELQELVEKPISKELLQKSNSKALKALSELEQTIDNLDTNNKNLNPVFESSKKKSSLLYYSKQLVKDLKYQYHQAKKAGYEPDLAWIKNVSIQLNSVLQKHSKGDGSLKPKDIHDLFKTVVRKETTSTFNRFCKLFNIGKTIGSQHEFNQSYQKVNKSPTKSYTSLYNGNTKSEVNLLKMADVLAKQPKSSLAARPKNGLAKAVKLEKENVDLNFARHISRGITGSRR